MSWEVSIWLVSALALILGAVAHTRRRERRAQRDAATLAQARADAADIPPSLHPVIDSNICMGSLSCVSACPEGTVLGLVDGAATLVRGASCIGHGRCALECPVDAIKLVFGTSQRGVDLPEVDHHFESHNPGVFVVGELGGMGLIKNAFRQGLSAGRHIAASLPPSPDETMDAVVVGAGPAGIAAGIALAQANLRYTILEQDSLGGTIAHYPRQKVVMTETVDIPGFGRFGQPRMSKEALLEGIGAMVHRFDLRIRTGVRVTGLEGRQDRFVISTSEGQVRARRVILAIGRRGTPRRLNVPGEDSTKVTYRLTEPDQYRGRKVLVVGGGDAAVEAAVQLSEAPGTEVTISYRKPAFARCRAGNRDSIQRALDSGRVRGLLPSQVQQIRPDHVVLTSGDERIELPNDYVIICAGGEPPTAFLQSAGVTMHHHDGREAMDNPAMRLAKDESSVREAERREQRQGRRLNRLLFVLGAAIVLALIVLGGDYYRLDEDARLDSPMHSAWRPAGDIGHGIGVIASLFMLSNFIYPLRKRLRWMKGAAPINQWMSFHVFVGIMSPTVIAFHAAFQSNNLLATWTFGSLGIVVLTGLAGRFAYGLIPRLGGEVAPLEQLKGETEALRNELRIRVPEALHAWFDRVTVPAARARPLPAVFVTYPTARLSTELRLRTTRQLRSRAGSPTLGVDVATEIRVLVRRRFQLEFYHGLRRFLGWWRILHVALALFLIVIMGAHIGVALFLGYGWILF